MTPDQLAGAVLIAAKAALADFGLDPSLLPEVKVERPRNPEHGDYASAIALQAARQTGLPPRELATAIAAKLADDEEIASVEVAGPGFLNIRLAAGAAGAIAGLIVRQGSRYGHSTALAGTRINDEFVSANPTGPIHLGGTRWAAVGDALARMFRAQGATVTTEYYFNDAGAQIDRFAQSLLAAARHEPAPEDGYAGEYIGEIAQTLVEQHPQILAGPTDAALNLVAAIGVELMFAEIKSSLSNFGVHFDVYFSERDLHDRGDLDRALARLDELGKVYQADGATWVRTSDYGDDKDRVIRRGTGQFTYFAADCAYYLDKRDRGFDKVMIVLGADHHGYVGRMRAVAACFGDDPDQTLEILIGQLVNLIAGGHTVRMSKRAGTVITIDDLVGAVGVDAARYALARYSLDSPIDLDLDLWTKRSTDNPVYYVQYAHVRIASLLRHSTELGFTLGDDYDASLLSDDRELTLLKALADFPGVLASAAELRQPHRIARYLEDLAGAYHRFHDGCRILPRATEEFGETSRARLWLARATQLVLASGLDLLGVTAPGRL
ncbi:MAG TPA: arginine--tRNA ligase [Streptosporangiaceae bacterium]|jgi:arginyl-tRNA synthetase